MKKQIALILTFAIILCSLTAGTVSAVSVTLRRHMIADWDSTDYSPVAPSGASVAKPYTDYQYGNALITGCATMRLTSYSDAAADTMLAMRVKLSSAVTPGTAHWTSILFYENGFSGPKGIETGSNIYYIPADSNQADISSYTTVDGAYSKTVENYNIRFEYGYEGWIVIPLSAINIDWWNGKGTVAPIAADKITIMDIIADLPAGSAIDEIQSFSGSVADFSALCGEKEKTLYRNLLADWDTAELTPATPAGASVGVPFEGYEFGNGLLTGPCELPLTPNTRSHGDNMLAFRVKSSASSSTFGANWTQLALWSTDLNKPQTLAEGSTVYYIPSAANDCSMVSFTPMMSGIYTFTVNSSNQFRLEFGYDGWLIFTLDDFNVDWWNSKATIAPVAPHKIGKLHIVSELAANSLIDEIQTFDGTVRDFKAACTSKATTKPFKRNMAADWDFAPYSPVEPEGTAVVAPEGYEFGNALSTGSKTISLTANSNAAGNNMLAFYIEDSCTVTPNTAHWITALLYREDVGCPQAVNVGSLVYYIPSDDNLTSFEIYGNVAPGVYSKSVENHDIRVDYGYKGWIIIDLKDTLYDWWGTITDIQAVSAEKLTVMDIVGDLADGTILDEIQTFTGTPKEFKAVCDTKLNVVTDRTAMIGADGIGDFNQDVTIDIRDLVNLKKRVANGGEWNADLDICFDGAFNGIDLVSLRCFLLSPVMSGNTKISDYASNTSVWDTPSIDQNKEFVYEGQVIYAGTNPWNISLLHASNAAEKTCDTTSDFSAAVKSYEWSSSGVLSSYHDSGDSITTRVQALDVVWNYLTEAVNGLSHPWGAMESYMRYQHYTAEFGYDYLGCEIGASVPGTSVSVAFARGAARQYGKAWFTDFSLWGAGNDGHGGTMLNYSDDTTAFNGAGEAVVNNANGGQGLTATRRSHIYSYMAGTSWLINEAGGNNAFYTNVGEDGYYELSPHGEVFKEVYDFTKRNSDRGCTYTPYALVLDYYHGLPYGLWNGNKVFECFTPDSGDMMTQNLLSLFYPGWNQLAAYGQNQLINTPYGDTADVLLQNASQTVLNSYPVVILSGSIGFKAEEIERYRQYVKQGGTLVLNTAYLDSFPEYRQEGSQYELADGNGRVIVYGDNYDVSRLSGILTALNSELIPFEISGDVQYLMNVKNGSLVLTLINNKGVTKPADAPEIIDESKTQQVTVHYTGSNSVLGVRDWISGNSVSTSATQTVTLKPGEVAVLEFIV